MSSTNSPAFQHYANAQEKFQPPLIANNNAFLGDVFSRYVRAPQFTAPLPYELVRYSLRSLFPNPTMKPPFDTHTARSSRPKPPSQPASTVSNPAQNWSTHTPMMR